MKFISRCSEWSSDRLGEEQNVQEKSHLDVNLHIKSWGLFLFFIYKVTNLVNGKLYIGFTTQSIQIRLKQHKKSKSALGLAIRKYGSDKFKIESIFCGFDKHDTITNFESYFIRVNNSRVPNGYNVSNGGECSRPKPDTYETISKKSKDNWKLNRENLLGKCVKYGFDNPSFGKPMSEEAKAKVRLKLKGIPLSEEIKEKNRIWNLANSPTRGIKRTKEHIEKSRIPMLDTLKKKHGVEVNGITYRSGREACEKLRITRKTLHKILNAGMKYRNCDGFARQNLAFEFQGTTYSSKNDFMIKNNLGRRAANKLLMNGGIRK